MEIGADLLTLIFAAGGAWAGVRYELRALRREVAALKKSVGDCPHHKPQPVRS